MRPDTVVQAWLDDLIMVFAFGPPLAALLLGVADVIAAWSTLLLSLVLYGAAPRVAGYFSRQALIFANI